MERTTTTGWRAPAASVSHLELRQTEKSAVFEAMRLAVVALGLKSRARHILEHLCGVYRGELIAGQMLVWPSNELLAERTGFSDRTIRYALADLIGAGVIQAKDSANGKRYARKSRAGQITDAFGFDLSPLLERLGEFKQRVAALKDLERDRRAQFDEVTIARRSCMEMLIAEPDDALERAFDLLTRETPARRSSQPVTPVLQLWRDLLARVRAHYSAACGGKDCRHKDQNNDAPEQSCKQESHEEVAGAIFEVDLPDVIAACSDVWRFGEVPTSARELVGVAGSLRGAAGVHRSAWEEAIELIGPLPAAVALVLVMQHEINGQKTGQMIKSPGGYFRFYVRKVAARQIDLLEEILRFRRKRQN